MTTNQIKLARHALGLDGARKVSYRNRYMAGVASDAYEEWQGMVRAGWAKLIYSGGYGDCFCLTYPGALAALESGERLDVEDFPMADGKAKP